MPKTLEKPTILGLLDRLRPPDLGTGRVEGRMSYLLAEMRFGRSSSERTR